MERVTIVACGTSYYAGLAARYWIEQTARVPVEIDIASEFRYRAPPLEDGGVALFISQSGETADTLAALRFAKEAGAPTAAVVNVRESTMAREADAVLPTYAGVEIGVASTKAFTTQLVTLACWRHRAGPRAGRHRRGGGSPARRCVGPCAGPHGGRAGPRRADPGARRDPARGRGRCSTSGAAPATPSPWKGRSS